MNPMGSSLCHGRTGHTQNMTTDHSPGPAPLYEAVHVVYTLDEVKAAVEQRLHWLVAGTDPLPPSSSLGMFGGDADTMSFKALLLGSLGMNAKIPLTVRYRWWWRLELQRLSERLADTKTSLPESAVSFLPSIRHPTHDEFADFPGKTTTRTDGDTIPGDWFVVPFEQAFWLVGGHDHDTKHNKPRGKFWARVRACIVWHGNVWVPASLSSSLAEDTTSHHPLWLMVIENLHQRVGPSSNTGQPSDFVLRQHTEWVRSRRMRMVLSLVEQALQGYRTRWAPPPQKKKQVTDLSGRITPAPAPPGRRRPLRRYANIRMEDTDDVENLPPCMRVLAQKLDECHHLTYEERGLYTTYQTGALGEPEDVQTRAAWIWAQWEPAFRCEYEPSRFDREARGLYQSVVRLLRSGIVFGCRKTCDVQLCPLTSVLQTRCLQGDEVWLPSAVRRKPRALLYIREQLQQNSLEGKETRLCQLVRNMARFATGRTKVHDTISYPHDYTETWLLP
jgi:hypothetical protein